MRIQIDKDHHHFRRQHYAEYILVMSLLTSPVMPIGNNEYVMTVVMISKSIQCFLNKGVFWILVRKICFENGLVGRENLP